MSTTSDHSGSADGDAAPAAVAGASPTRYDEALERFVLFEAILPQNRTKRSSASS